MITVFFSLLLSTLLRFYPLFSTFLLQFMDRFHQLFSEANRVPL